MAEKEERIEQFITIQQRTITTRDYETNDEIISKIYPRKAAIERIAKALCADDVMREGYYQMAEAALNALLK